MCCISRMHLLFIHFQFARLSIMPEGNVPCEVPYRPLKSSRETRELSCGACPVSENILSWGIDFPPCKTFPIMTRLICLVGLNRRRHQATFQMVRWINVILSVGATADWLKNQSQRRNMQLGVTQKNKNRRDESGGKVPLTKLSLLQNKKIANEILL